MMRRVLKGLQKAAVVFYSTADVRRRIEQYGLLDPAKLVQVPYGVSQEFGPEPTDDDSAAESMTGLNGRPFLLHVGSCIPRKRIDVLLDVYAELHRRLPEFMLVQVGGVWTADQQSRIDRLGLQAAVIQRRGLHRRELATLYRRSSLVLLPSEAEGFGLPLIEALACGARVVVSDIPVLREVGGGAVSYCPVGQLQQWTETVCQMIADPTAGPDRESRLAQASRFSWSRHAHEILSAYRRLG
jgi:glycosyltransferase involved in cell wall biosynthesis